MVEISQNNDSNSNTRVENEEEIQLKFKDKDGISGLPGCRIKNHLYKLEKRKMARQILKYKWQK
jgi:hypothetical protein